MDGGVTERTDIVERLIFAALNEWAGVSRGDGEGPVAELLRQAAMEIATLRAALKLRESALARKRKARA